MGRCSHKKGNRVVFCCLNNTIPNGNDVYKVYIGCFEPLCQYIPVGKGENMAKEHHVVPNPKGGWDVERAGASRVSAHTETKKEAVDLGREISRNQGTEFVIHGKDGVIQAKDSHGNDPRNIHG
jgi:hypothetical protein